MKKFIILTASFVFSYAAIIFIAVFPAAHVAIFALKIKLIKAFMDRNRFAQQLFEFCCLFLDDERLSSIRLDLKNLNLTYSLQLPKIQT